MEHDAKFSGIRTSDSSSRACVLNVTPGKAPVTTPFGIFLRHNTAVRWCGAGGDWLAERERAVRFATNIDALVYCQALDLRGLLVAFDSRGQEVYKLNVERILDLLAGDSRVRSLYKSRQSNT